VLDPAEVVALHAEFTSRCNLHCKHCARTNPDNGNTIDSLPLQSVDPATFEHVLTQLPNLKLIHSCGNYGDIVAYNHLFDIVEICKQHNIELLRLYTNGSARLPQYWQDLGTLCSDSVEVVFSIDGLEDTNHIYRDGSNWNSIMANTQAFISAGGNAIWEMLVFSHNEHQVDQAKALASKMGFKEFRVKKANRFHLVDKETVKPTKIEQFRHTVEESSVIHCKYQDMKWLYMSFEGELMPCCWIGGSKYKTNQQKNQFLDFYNSCQGVELDVTRNSVKDILKGTFFTELQKSWSNEPLTVCKNKCSNCNSVNDKYVVG
jgi:MoaA/NifB/PqqE/SkfB family radical SAM enzyme